MHWHERLNFIIILYFLFIHHSTQLPHLQQNLSEAIARIYIYMILKERISKDKSFETKLHSSTSFVPVSLGGRCAQCAGYVSTTTLKNATMPFPPPRCLCGSHHQLHLHPQLSLQQKEAAMKMCKPNSSKPRNKAIRFPICMYIHLPCRDQGMVLKEVVTTIASVGNVALRG